MLERVMQPRQPAKNEDESRGLLSLTPDSLVVFADTLPLRELSGQEARVISVRSYVFGEDSTVSYSLSINGTFGFHLTVAQDEEGIYLGLSRELPRSEWSDWFDEDALDFFLTPSSARILKLKPTTRASAQWSAPRYNKIIEAAEGVLHDGIPAPDNVTHAQRVQYSLLASDTGEKSIEIEHLPEKHTTRLYATLYRPKADIISFERADAGAKPRISRAEDFYADMEVEVEEPVAQPTVQEALAPLAALSPKHQPRPDFRRREPALSLAHQEEEGPALPSFLLEPKQTQESERYMSLDEIIPPEPERLRCDIVTARALIQEANTRKVAVRDVVRNLVGLSLGMKEEVMFDLPLSDNDYKELAMRYQVKASNRAEIRERLAQELKERVIERF